jgi:DegV family protein with EDD domain
MHDDLMKAVAVGYERMVAWADVLDRINVYPVPDGDTGRNLVITLGACRNVDGDINSLISEILLSARGNSGNIAAAFLSGFLACNELSSLPASAQAGCDLAFQAVPDPQQGTIISLFDTMAVSLKRTPPEETGAWVDSIIRDMEETVRNTASQLPELKKAGVVDAGALGMFVFLEPLLHTLVGHRTSSSLFSDDLKDSFNVSATGQDSKYKGYCFDVLLRVEQEEREIIKHVMDLGESVVATPHGDYLKVHLHADDKEKVRQDLTAVGTILSWAEDDLAEQTMRFGELKKNQAIHIMTDAAGSLTKDLAQKLQITLLNSYIAVGGRFTPETYMDPSQLFAAMRAGAKVSTSQPSIIERHECYHNVMKCYSRVLYLCVGSFYTGNYDVVMKWKAENDPGNRMVVIDTGLASGKLGLIARAVAELSLAAIDPLKVIAFAKNAIEQVEEYIFLDTLQFLAAGGRISKTGAFFGDIFHIKPIISPYADGARKIGVAKSTKDQVKFAFRHLEKNMLKDRKTSLLLEYTDNREWLEGEIKPEIERRFPLVKVIVQSLSLTTAVHAGPGTWGIAFLAGESPRGNKHV